MPELPRRFPAVEADFSLPSGALSLKTREGLSMIEIVAPAASPTLPGPNQVVSGPFGDLLWLAQRRFLHVYATGTTATLDLAGFHAVECGHGRFALRVTGLHARELIAKSCPLDLHARTFPKGACAQSLVADAPMLLHAFDTLGIDLYMERSLSRSTTELLVDQAKEFLAPRAAHSRFLGLGEGAR